MQKLKDASFGKTGINLSRNPQLFWAYSDIKAHSQHTLLRLYSGAGNFWGKEIKKGNLKKYIEDNTDTEFSW
jgi:hypothetical protein